jgi:very-short-patch-repair endonuclease
VPLAVAVVSAFERDPYPPLAGEGRRRSGGERSIPRGKGRKLVTEIVRGKRVSAPQLAAARDLRSRQTPAEQYLWQHLRAGRIDGLRFRRQQPLGPYILDFYCSVAKLVIEVDGPIHNQQLDYDRERDAYLSAHDLRVLRFPNDTVLRNIDTVLRTIRETSAHP